MSGQSELEATLLRALAECWPYPAAFDASNISGAVQGQRYPALLPALGFLNLRWLKGTGRLSTGSNRALDKWLWKIDGRERGGLILRRDRLGWCRVSPMHSSIEPQS